MDNPMIMEIKKKTSPRALVKCDQCKVKATMTGMKMHLKTAHSSANPKLTSRNKTDLRTSETMKDDNIFKCDNCEYRSNNRAILMKHIDAIHLIPVKLRIEQSKLMQVKCSMCVYATNSETLLVKHAKESHAEPPIQEEELIKEGDESVNVEINLDEEVAKNNDTMIN